LDVWFSKVGSLEVGEEVEEVVVTPPLPPVGTAAEE
jgi:hypothetical protein